MVLKQLFDSVLSFFLVILLLPLFLLISVLIKLDSRGPVFFVQERIGKAHRPFQIYKFRTMIPNAIHMGTGIYTDEKDPRITRIGRFLRNTSLDELPQLLNILKGDMSFIGPRPTIQEQVLQYDAFQRKRLQMKPGITGLAQVNGRNSISWPERIKFDVQYVENWTAGLDLKILFRTVAVILKREGLYGEKENFVIRRDKHDDEGV
ncbi:MAG: sugar transferase [Thermoclostridium sp.]|nr:sugar transferase [Thermoclostridium sp.]